MGLAFCSVAFLAAFVLTWRSVAFGLGTVLTVGYCFGIMRANFLDTLSYFAFDAAVLGFFLSYFGGGGLKTILDPNLLALQRWTFMLIAWTVLMFLIPLQHPLVQLVGLRGNAYLLPFILVGGRLTRDDAIGLALWLGVLNHVAFGFAVAEYFIGVPSFFPENAVTEIIYKSKDIANYTAMRIPSTFSSSASYGGTMVLTVPWLLGAWIQPRLVDWQKMFLVSATAVAMVGIFLCGARMCTVLLGVVAVVATFSRHLRSSTIWLVWSLLIAGVVYIVSGEERLRRFMSLQDADAVADRIHGSVNVVFLDLVIKYPFGNGLGAGGTSIPAFLHNLVQNPVGIENEYGRILLEQGLAGLALWIVFVIWFLGRRPVAPRDSWQFGKTLMWCLCLASFVSAMIGVGLMTSIPSSSIFFLSIGFVCGPPLRSQSPRPQGHSSENAKNASVPATAIAPAKL
jgi:hypothetical protein